MIIEERVCIHTHIYIYIYTYTYVYIHIHIYMIIYMTSFEVSGVILFLVSYHIISFFFLCLGTRGARYTKYNRCMYYVTRILRN